MTEGLRRPRVLIVDDDPTIRRFLRSGLLEAGYLISEAQTGHAAIDLASGADLMVLDLGLPDMDGMEVVRTLRASGSPLPVVVLSSRTEEGAKVAALDLGADDYVTKPFGMPELLARLRAAARHKLQQLGEAPVFRAGELRVDLVRRHVTMQGVLIRLSAREYALLRLLVAHAGKVLTHKFILDRVWSSDVDVQYLRIYIRALRQKLEPDPERPSYVLTEIGVGYRLRAPDWTPREGASTEGLSG